MVVVVVGKCRRSDVLYRTAFSAKGSLVVARCQSRSGSEKVQMTSYFQAYKVRALLSFYQQWAEYRAISHSAALCDELLN